MAMGTGGDSMLSEINVTPFVDVMLVLLIIFMVTAPMMVQGVEIELPNADAPPLEVQDDEDQLILTIDANGAVFIGETPVEWDTLGAQLAAINKRNPDANVFVRADGSIRYDKVLQLMAMAKAAGIGKVGLVTEPRVEPDEG